MSLRKRIANLAQDPTNQFALAFALTVLGAFLRFEPRYHRWLIESLGVPADLSSLLIRSGASMLLVFGSVFLFVASRRLRSSGKKGLIHLWLERRRQRRHSTP